MILINNKSLKELDEQTELEFIKLGISATPGSIARLFSKIINKNLGDFYDTLTENHLQCFLTTSTGQYLDNIGMIVNCVREKDEDDINFRKRISKQVLSLSKANEISIRLAVLSCEDVDDVILKRYSFGPGSMTIIPVAKKEDYDILNNVKSVVEETCSYGEKVVVKFPIKKYVKININVLLVNGISDIERQEIHLRVEEEVRKYINSLKVNEAFIINELTQRVMQVDDKIIDFSCNDFKINNRNCLFINQGARWDEKFFVSPDENSINIS